MSEPNGDRMIIYNGDDTKVRDIPDPPVRQMMGYGHYNPHHREVVPDPDGNTWPYTPDTCEYGDEPGHTRWILNNSILVCTGCGLDGT